VEDNHFMRSLKFIFSVLLSLISVSISFAQTENIDLIDRTYLEYVDRLPDNLTSEKSVAVLIADTRAQGEKMAVETQPVFAKSGIDAVAYYHIDDLFAGTILSKPIANEFLKREIVQLIFLIKKASGYVVVITPFSKDENFVKHGKKAWRMESRDLADINNQIYRMSTKLERKNFLISEAPEYGRFQHRVAGRRYDAYKPDLKSQKLAVPLFVPITLSEEHQNKPGYDEVAQGVKAYNKSIALKNSEIKQAFVDYPYPHVFIEEELTEKQLRGKGFTYVLHHIHTTSNVIRDLLKYEKKQGVTDYVVVRMTGSQGEVVRINGDVPVYKYYVRNIPGDTYFLGSKWDADYTQMAALNNHVQLMIAQIR